MPQVYGVAHKIEFIVADSSQILRGLQARKAKAIRQAGVGGGVGAMGVGVGSRGASWAEYCVCIAPPWGGPDYLVASVQWTCTMATCIMKRTHEILVCIECMHARTW
jgi:hypothetical protein